MPSFGGEAKPSTPCRKIIRHVKVPCGETRILLRLNSRTFLANSFATRCLCYNWRALVDESGIMRTKMGMHNGSENECSAWDASYDTIPYSNQYFLVLYKSLDSRQPSAFTSFISDLKNRPKQNHNQYGEICFE
jgi:hypothetical protein